MRPPFQLRPTRSIALVLACVLLACGPVLATDPAAPAADEAATPTQDGWTAWVDTEHGFLIELPASHALGRAGRQWFLHGFYDGDPTVPDATITYLPGRDLPRALKESFPVEARTERLTFGDDRTTGLRVTSVYRTPDGTPYEESGYLIEAPEGTYRIGRYESFDWAPFDAAVRSFRFVHLVPSDVRD